MAFLTMPTFVDPTYLPLNSEATGAVEGVSSRYDRRSQNRRAVQKPKADSRTETRSASTERGALYDAIA